MLILYIIVLLQFSKNKITPKIKEKIVTEIIYDHRTASSTKHRNISKRKYDPNMNPAYPSYPYYWVFETEIIQRGIDYYVYNSPEDGPYLYHLDKDSLFSHIDKVNTRKTIYDDQGRIDEDISDRIDIKNTVDWSEKIISNNVDSTREISSIKYYYKTGLDEILYTDNTVRNQLGVQTTRYNYEYKTEKRGSVNKSIIRTIKRNGNSNSEYVRTGYLDRFQSNNLVNTDSVTFSYDDKGNTTKRLTYYQPDDCSYGGYAHIDSVFNHKGQFITIFNRAHLNGTTMGPPFMKGEYFYHDNGIVSHIKLSGGYMSETNEYFNENGNMIRRTSYSPEPTELQIIYNSHEDVIRKIHFFENREMAHNRWEYVYNDKGLKSEVYAIHQPEQTTSKHKSLVLELVNEEELGKHLIETYVYNEFDDIIEKNEYDSYLSMRYKKNILKKSTTYQYKYF